MTILSMIDAGPDLEFYGDYRSSPRGDERHCSCGTILSRYNRSSLCYPCDERIRRNAPLPVIRTTVKYQRERHVTRSQRRLEYQAVLRAVREQSEPSTSREIAQCLGIGANSVAGYLQRAEREGYAEKAGSVKRVKMSRGRLNQAGGALFLWRWRESV